MSGCPADAVKRVKDISDFIAGHDGGEGAVRDFIEWIWMRIEPMYLSRLFKKVEGTSPSEYRRKWRGK